MSVFVRHPVDNPRISQQFGQANTWENPPWHKGIDYAAPQGTPIYAPCDGFIVWASFDTFPPGNTWEMIPYNPGSGGCTILQPSDPNATALQTSFSHQSRIDVKPGQFVKAGQVIGAVGTTGNSTGPHLHWEVFIDYSEGAYPVGTFYGRVNPLEYFSTATVVPFGSGGKGTATIQEDDDMASPEVISALADIAQRISITNDNVQAGTKSVRADLATVHNTIIKDVGSQLGNIQKGVTQKVDVESLAMELAGKLEARDLEALAQKLTVTVKEN